MTDAGWEREIAELHERQRAAEAMGGPDKVRIQHGKGKLTVRERIAGLLDPASFREVGSIAGAGSYAPDGTLTGFSPSNLLFGRGRIDGRPVVVSGDDFTVRGGAADASIHEKLNQAEQMANELRLPHVRLLDGSGGGGSVKTLESSGHSYIPAIPGWNWAISNLATVPVVSLGLGPIAGLGAARLVTSHYSLLLRQQGQMFAAGPAIVSALGQNVTKEELGGAEMHARSGSIDDIAEDEADAFAKTRRFLSYLPQSIDSLAGRAPTTDPTDRSEAWLDSIVPRSRRHVYKMRRILDGVLDAGSFFEIGRQWGRSVITGLARLDGWPVAVIASDPMIYGGAWTADSGQKLVRFIDLAETFHVPVVHLVDIPGLMVGVEAERNGTIRQGARALASVYQATVPWCTVIIRKAFGVAGAATANHTRFHYRYAWPSGDWGSLPVEGGIEAAYKAQLEASPDPVRLRAEIEQRLNRARSPFLTAEKFLVEEIIAPRETRPLLCEFANLAAPLRRVGQSAFGYRP
jgi:acetyl-CoA carboxylase carboxyltransferase component